MLSQKSQQDTKAGATRRGIPDGPVCYSIQLIYLVEEEIDIVPSHPNTRALARAFSIFVIQNPVWAGPKADLSLAETFGRYDEPYKHVWPTHQQVWRVIRDEALNRPVHRFTVVF